MKVGLYGGTFDPIHTAHLIIAQHIRESLALDKVIFVPAARPPGKRVFSPARLRFDMVRKAVAEAPGFECSDIEIKRSGASYSVDTVAQMRERLSIERDSLFFIMGSDNFVCIDKWKDPERILSLCQIVVFPRNRVDVNDAPAAFRDRVIYLDQAPLIDIAATGIRSRVARGLPVSFLVPPEVERFIEEHALYRQG